MASESKHTPGPWEAHYPEGSNGYWYIEPDSRPNGTGRIATAYHADTPEQVASNARLIAAAPDLLVALEELYTHHAYKDPEAQKALDTPVMAKARAAIAKAKGE